MLNKKEIIDLDECVINALNLFIDNPLPNLNIDKFQKPLVVGSGNAAATGKILFHNKDAIFADESDYLDKLNRIKNIGGGVIISASGGKHAPIIASELKKRNVLTSLITNNKDAPAKTLVNETFVFPKNKEPYTYNTSTYLGMILSMTKEDPKIILEQIKKIKKKIPKNLKNYDSYFFIIPENLELIKEMFLTKFDELFGSRISARVFTIEQVKHSKTIIPSDKELFLYIGVGNNIFGKKRFFIPLEKNADYGTIMALGYFFIGNIQKQNKPYFKENLEKYCKESSKIFGETISPIVE